MSEISETQQNNQKFLLEYVRGLLKRCEAGEVDGLVVYESVRAQGEPKAPLSVVDSSTERSKIAKALLSMVLPLIEDESASFSGVLTTFTEEDEAEEANA